MERKKWLKDSWREILLCGAAATLFPTVIMLYFCARNVNEISTLWITVAVPATIAVMAAIAYLLVLLVLRKAFSALVFCTVCWLGCYAENLIRQFVLTPLRIKHGTLLILTAIILGCACAAAILGKSKNGSQKALELLFTLILLVVFIINLVPIIRATAQKNKEVESELSLKTQFDIQESTCTPNIFWIHPDGMLGIDAVEKYYGDSQEEFVTALTDKGFAVNAIASFEAAHKTSIAIPILTCPYAYDSWISKHTTSHQKAEKMIHNYGLLFQVDTIRKNNEMEAAFAQKGYDLALIGAAGSHAGLYYPLFGAAFYDNASNSTYNRMIFAETDMNDWSAWSEFQNFQDMNLYFKLLGDYTFSLWEKMGIYKCSASDIEPYGAEISEDDLTKIVASDLKEAPVIRALYDILYAHYQQPHFTIIHDLTPHCAFIYNEDGTQHEPTMDPLAYHAQHVWSGKLLLGMLDMILEADPDAVIVIQADHGLHGNTEEDFKTAFGEDADPIELWNSTMSAIRVPEKYQTGEEHYAMENPLNISRYLVNSFVGKNYDYLPPN